MMNKQDEWEKIIRSKLEDYEVRPDPADWEAIAGRLTRRRLWPRQWMYAAAAVALLMIVLEGGRRLWRREEPAVRVADARPVPSAPTDAQPTATSTAAIPPETTAAPATSANRHRKASTIATAPSTMALRSAAVMREVPPTSTDPTPDEPSVPSESWIADAMTDVADSLQLFADEVPTAEEIEASIELPTDRPAVTEAKPIRRWSFGMGGGGYTTGLQGGSADFSAINARDENRADLPPYNYGIGTEDNAYTSRHNEKDHIDVKHSRPLSFGLGVSYRLNDRWALQSGVMYTCLTSRWHTASIFNGHIRQRLHFVGVPVGVSYRIADWQRIQFYAAAGGAVEWNVAGSLRSVYYYGTEKLHWEQSQRMKEWQWSAYARTGAAYPLLRFLSLYAEVGASYYFDNGSSIETIRSAKPFYVSLQTGLRLGL